MDVHAVVGPLAWRGAGRGAEQTGKAGEKKEEVKHGGHITQIPQKTVMDLRDTLTRHFLLIY